MTSFIAAGGSGRSTSVIPAVPAASSVTTIAFIPHLPGVECSPVTLLHRRLRSALGEATALRWIRQLNALERCPCRQKSSTEQKDGDPPAPRRNAGRLDLYQRDLPSRDRLFSPTPMRGASVSAAGLRLHARRGRFQPPPGWRPPRLADRCGGR